MTQPLDIFSSAGELPDSAFRDAMSRVAAAVHIVTSAGAGGRAGFTATAVSSVSDTPPTLLVCLNRLGRSADALARNGVFCVNTLGVDDQMLADVFAGRTGAQGEARFAQGAWGSLATGSPVLATALVAFDCRVVESVAAGSHQVILGRIEAVRLGTQPHALLYKDRVYTKL